ncbi:MAG: family 20 glycosylhydrolase [Prevotella sp.]|nr:family 20 glycosylhydrolase [Prevotella sp.]
MSKRIGLFLVLLWQFCALAAGNGFEYRGLMLDCSRHFWPKEFLMKQIDAMAMLRMNKLHLHLTDAGGWRLEIKAFPRLTSHAAWRTEENWTRWWTQGDRRYCTAETEGAYGGFYTQDDIAEIVEYASERGIDIVPEIEMPGHSEEVLFAYPELSCTGEAYGCSDFCIGNEATFDFVERVLDEVLQLFPSKLIHIGGDEAGRQKWATCPRCQERMKAENLQTTAELQAWFTRRVGKYLESKGRRLMGWDEILEGIDGDAPDYVVMAWRGTERAVEAAQRGFDVVLTPSPQYYLDYYQDAPPTQPLAMGDYSPLEQVWAFSAVVDSLAKSQIGGRVLGVQGNLWTEMIATPEHAEMMIYPRLMAIAEAGLGRTLDDFSQNSDEFSPNSDENFPNSDENFEDFRRRAITFCDTLRSKGYSPFDLRSEVGLRREFSQPAQHEAVGKPVRYLQPYFEKYRGSGDTTLTDGLQGGWSYNDGRWQGFIRRERLDVVVDMQRSVPLRDVTVSFLQFTGPEIYAPAEFIVSVSDDGEHFSELSRQLFEVDLSDYYTIRTLTWKGLSKGRYVRVQARSSAHGGWIFTDEIVINSALR